MPEFPGAQDVRPTEIMREPQTRTLRIAWKDGHLSRYPYDRLRGLCPCAGCGEARKQGKEFEPGPLPAVVPMQPNVIDLVGNYAIQIAWSDGHDTGIYSFRLLREECPCDACAAQRSG